MSSSLPIISGREAVSAFKKVGFQLVPGRGKGSHMVMAKPDYPAILTIPDHRELKRGLLRALIRKAGMTVEEFVSQL